MTNGIGAKGNNESGGSSLKKLFVALFILICLAIIAVLAYMLYTRPEPEPEQPTIQGREMVGPITSPEVDSVEDIERLTKGKPLPPSIISGEDPNIVMHYNAVDEHVRGDPTTPIAFIEYADLRSRFAGVLNNQIKDFLNKNSNHIHWVFRHFPYGPNEVDYIAPRASECVFLQLGDEKFWEYVDLMLSEKNVSMDTIFEFANNLGVNQEEFKVCMDTDRTYNAVLSDKQNAMVYETIQVTPSFIFFDTRTGEMRIIDGVNSVHYFQAVLNEMLGVSE